MDETNKAWTRKRSSILSRRRCWRQAAHLNVEQLHGLFDGRSAPPKPEIRKAIAALIEEYEGSRHHDQRGGVGFPHPGHGVDGGAPAKALGGAAATLLACAVRDPGAGRLPAADYAR